MNDQNNLPENWESKRLDEIGDVYSGSTPSTSVPELWDGSITWITPNDLSKLSTPYISNSDRSISKKGLKNSSTHLLPARSIVISSRAPIGYIAIPLTDFCTNQGCKSIELNDGYNSEYVYYNLNFHIDKLKNLGNGTTFSEITKTALCTVELPFPKQEEEQTQIAAVLSCIDRAIEQTEAFIAKQKRIKIGLMQDLLTKGIDDHGNIRSEETHEFKDSPVGVIPKEWEIYSLEYLTTKIVDGVHKTPKYVESGIPFITISDLTSADGIDFSSVRYVTQKDHNEFKKRADPKAGDVLVTKDGTLGIAKVIPEGLPEFSIFVSVAQLRPNKQLCFPELIWAFFESGRFEAQLGKLSAGTGLKHIHLEHFRKFLIPTPPLTEQQRIFSSMKIHANYLQNETAELEKLKLIKSGLMQDLLTGKVSPSDLLS